MHEKKINLGNSGLNLELIAKLNTCQTSSTAFSRFNCSPRVFFICFISGTHKRRVYQDFASHKAVVLLHVAPAVPFRHMHSKRECWLKWDLEFVWVFQIVKYETAIKGPIDARQNNSNRKTFFWNVFFNIFFWRILRDSMDCVTISMRRRQTIKISLGFERARISVSLFC